MTFRVSARRCQSITALRADPTCLYRSLARLCGPGALLRWPRPTTPNTRSTVLRVLYHVAPQTVRASIQRHGLNSSLATFPALAGTYLWVRRSDAVGYAAPFFDDIWAIDCTGLPLELGGPYSIALGERWTADPIPPHRILGRLGEVPVFPEPACIASTPASRNPHGLAAQPVSAAPAEPRPRDSSVSP